MSKYDPAFVDQVRKWYIGEGKSDSEIAKLAPLPPHRVHLTRNAVIGLRQRATPPITRAEELRRPTMARPARPRLERETKPAPPAQRPEPRPIQRPTPPPPPVTPTAPPYRTKAELVSRTGPTLLELGPNQCRNPVGPDARPDRPQMFCGARVGTREVEVRKGEFRDVVDTYCPSCAARNRIGTSSASALIRSARAFA